MALSLRLKPFHRQPPKVFKLELSHECAFLLGRYTDYYNQTFNTEVKQSEVASAIIEQFLKRDRQFRQYLRSSNTNIPASSKLKEERDRSSIL